ncbi:glucose PTS transporter subunit IIA [Mixta calida]|uniref:glucose PTS transporter subunit IIA n=2 Tax=Mixta calida TaxID=665913 RepID=UPI00289EDF43|nr:glucose PTS transporter subunit IIA [Mixta calida]MDU5190674.1 glucose PTS transporter subunit IIA [Mixta calida]MDU5767287.1 glucose PTS transporter subunit IIA [Mixta calida]MDU5825397.1 glucose PTS transporter subunit IIA [Mixta calida]MDU6415938.1 glucose PTS transporter subunit IIA [Mixta calida]
MGKIRDYSRLAADILQETGGETNLISFSRCATRLRLVLKETPPGAVEKIKALPGVITVVLSGGQFQVVIGTHVADVYDALAAIVDPDKLQQSNEKRRVLDTVIATMSAVFAPIIYVLAAAGILQGILITVNYFLPAFQQTGAFSVLNFISWTPFAFLPVFIAVTASKFFKCNMFIALFCCCALINPEWATLAAQIAKGEAVTFFSLPLAQTVYTSSVLPPLFLVLGLSYLERLVNRVLPQVVAPLFTPLICAVIMVPLTLVLIGPVTSGLANGIAMGYNWLFDTAPALAAAVIGGVWQVIVIFGVHWGITPVVMANFDLHGRDSFQAFQTMAVVGQMAAAFACAIKAKQRGFKTVAWSAGLTGVFGITEPAIYGVTLKLKKPFICGCIGGAVGAIVTSLFGSYYYAYAGLPGVLTIVNAISPENPMSFIGELTGVLVTMAATFILVFLVGFREPEAQNEAGGKAAGASVGSAHSEATASSTGTAPAAAGKTLTLMSPVAGNALPLASVNDESFAGGLLGDGIAIVPEEDVIVAPCDAEVASTVDSHHAVGLVCDNGAEILIHVGLDTVNLDGQHFSTLVQVGDRVTAGTPLIRFQRNAIVASGYDITTPFLVMNSDEYRMTKCVNDGPVDSGAPVMTVS